MRGVVGRGRSRATWATAGEGLGGGSGRSRLAVWLAALVLGAGAAGGCAPIRGWRAQVAPPQPPELREDAGPRVYAENEVDVPARPVAPIRPVYPPRMRALGVPGEVEARIIVSADGAFAGGRVVESTNDDFTAAARTAIRAARFHPALRAGRAVASWVTLRVHFELDR